MIGVENSSMEISPVNECEYSVVWSDKVVTRSLDNDRPASRTYSGIDYGKVDRTFREVRITGSEREGCELNVVRRYLVTDVDDLTSWVDRKDCSFDRTHEVVGTAKVSQQRNHYFGAAVRISISVPGSS
jgi:hypothetical protein